jgi:YD repeat-containing protein
MAIRNRCWRRKLLHPVGLLLLAALAPLCFAAQTTYQYDELGRLKSVTSADGTTVVYEYDPAFNRRTVTTTAATPGSLRFSASSYSGGEASGLRTVTVTVSRVSGSSGAASVSYATSNGTATAGSDYTAASGTLSWVSGDAANKTFTVNVLDDTSAENSETINLTLSSAVGANLGSPSAATISITDNDLPPAGTLQFSAATYSIGEAGPSATITVTRVGGSGGAVGVSYATSSGTATSGTDFTAASGTLSWATGNTSNKTFVVAITEDAVFEGNETVNIALSAPTGGATVGSPANATLTIVENDSAPTGSLRFSSASYSVGEAGPSVTITVTRVNGSAGTASVNYATASGTATAAADFTATSGTLNWASGDSANKTFTVPILEDSLVEGAETFTATLSGATGASLGSPASATITITDNDNPPAGTLQLSSSAYSVAESGGSVSITVTRSGGSFGALTVAYGTSNQSAVSGSDYTAVSGQLSWADGDAASKSFAVPITDDGSVETDETFGVSLSTVVGTLGSPASATVTITDNDLPAITIADRTVQTQGSAGATARYRLTSAGDIVVSPSSAGGPDADVGDWLTPKMSMSRFEALATHTFGNYCQGTFGTWLNLGSNVEWRVVMSNGSALAVGDCRFTLQIRDSVTLNVLGTAVINVVAVDTPP